MEDLQHLGVNTVVDLNYSSSNHVLQILVYLFVLIKKHLLQIFALHLETRNDLGFRQTIINLIGLLLNLFYFSLDFIDFLRFFWIVHRLSKIHRVDSQNILEHVKGLDILFQRLNSVVYTLLEFFSELPEPCIFLVRNLGL